MTNPHKYGTPEWMVDRITEWIGQNGGEDSISLTMYEAQKTIERMQQELADARQDNISLLCLLALIREACGDNGKRMQDELVTFIRDQRQSHLSHIALLKASLKQAGQETDAELERVKALKVALEHCLDWLPEDCSAASEAAALLEKL